MTSAPRLGEPPPNTITRPYRGLSVQDVARAGIAARGAAGTASTSTHFLPKKPPTPPTIPSRCRTITASAPSSARICGSNSSSEPPR